MNGRRDRGAAGIYRWVWSTVVRWFRVPEAPPELPAGSAEQVRSFRPSDGFLRYLKFKFWILLVIVDATLTILWLALVIAMPLVGTLAAPLALAVIVLPDVVAYIAIHLQYDTTWYVISDRSMRLRRGIWTIRETTLTYNNIQNVKVIQGPLQRYFGIADLVVETAGGGGGEPHHGGGMGAHMGRIVGVSNAAEIRQLIMTRAAISGASGLDDRDESPTVSGWTAEHIQVLREIADMLRMPTERGKVTDG